MIARSNRVYRRRTRGWTMPEGAVYVGRPTMWGNPFMGRQWGHAKSVQLHRRWLNGQIGALTLERMGFCPSEVDALDRLRARVLTSLHTLAGRHLACWCPLNSRFCHAETLLDLAPEYAAEQRGARAMQEAAAKEADPPLMKRKGRIGLWRQRRAAIAASIRSIDLTKVHRPTYSA